MAFLIPDNLRSRKDVPDAIRRVATAFQVGLDESATVWYEPLFDPTGERPHLVVLEPGVGVVVIEVLTGRDKSKLLGALRGKLRVQVDGVEQEVDDPLVRATALATSLRATVADADSLPDVPIGSAAVFSGISRKDAEKLGADRVVDLDHCIFKPDLDAAIDDGNGAGLLRVLHRSTPTSLEDELDGTALDTLRGLIHPDVLISAAEDQGALFSPGTGTGKEDRRVQPVIATAAA